MCDDFRTQIPDSVRKLGRSCGCSWVPIGIDIPTQYNVLAVLSPKYGWFANYYIGKAELKFFSELLCVVALFLFGFHHFVKFNLEYIILNLN